MKKLFVLFVLFSAFAFGQNQDVVLRLTNLLEATTQTGYVDLGNWARIDSVSLALAGVGEIDIDSVVTYPGFKVRGGESYYGSTAYTFLADPNVAASTKFWTNGVASAADKDAATVLTSAVMRHGINTLKVVVYPADGSESGNVLYCIFRVYGVPRED